MCTNYCLNLCEYQLIVKRKVYICIFSLISLSFDFFQHFVCLSCRYSYWILLDPPCPMQPKVFLTAVRNISPCK